jgi:hypothetical protein
VYERFDTFTGTHGLLDILDLEVHDAGTKGLKLVGHVNEIKLESTHWVLLRKVSGHIDARSVCRASSVLSLGLLVFVLIILIRVS